MANIIVPQIAPPGLIDPTTAKRHPIDSAERFYASNIRGVEQGAIYLAGAQKLSVGSWAGRWSTPKNTQEYKYRRFARTMYTKFALFFVLYGTQKGAVGAVAGRITATTTTGGAADEIVVQDTGDLDIGNLILVSQALEIGAGTNADGGYEDLTVDVNNTSSVAHTTKNIVVFAFGIVPLPMQNIAVP